LEIDRVGEDKPGVWVNASRGKEVAYLAARLPLHPDVDGVPHRLGVAREIRLPHPSPVVLARDVEEGLAEREALLSPRAVGRAELVAAQLSATVEAPPERAKGGVELL